MGNALSWLGTAVGDVGDWYGENKDWVSPALSLAGTMYSQRQQQQAAEKAQKQNMALWQQTAFPNQAAMTAAATENRGQLGQARLGSYQNLANQLAARGFGSGSGLMARGGSDIERGYGQAYGNMLTGLTKFANTPTSGLPAQAYAQPQQSAMGAGMNWFTGYLDQSRGYQDIIKLIQQMNQQNRNTGGGNQGQGRSLYGNNDYYSTDWLQPQTSPY